MFHSTVRQRVQRSRRAFHLAAVAVLALAAVGTVTAASTTPAAAQGTIVDTTAPGVNPTDGK